MERSGEEWREEGKTAVECQREEKTLSDEFYLGIPDKV